MRLRFVRVASTFLAVLLASKARGAGPDVPTPTAQTAYQRIQPVFRSKVISKDEGDALLAALDGGSKLKLPPPPPANILVDYAPAYYYIRVVRPGLAGYDLGFTYSMGVVYLPDNHDYVIDADARDKIRAILADLQNDLMREIVTAQRPCIYAVATVDDGGTLSGIARLFYHDPARWKVIYNANRRTIKNPNVIGSGMKLTIPKLP